MEKRMGGWLADRVNGWIVPRWVNGWVGGWMASSYMTG